MNSGGHEDTEITRINAQFIECDSQSFDEQLDKIKNFPIEPSLIVKTRKSLHTYWLMKIAKVDKFREVQKQLISHFDGDSACVNESRVLRLPGFYHQKQDPVMVECIKFNPELRYTQEELKKVLPKLKNTEKTEHNMQKNTRKGIDLVINQCDFIKNCKENVKNLPEHDWYAMITNLAVFEGGSEIIHEFSKGYDGYSRDETDNKILHFLNSNTRPITCKTIFEKGFNCSKYEDGSCGVKSPASLCYKPLEVEELKVCLSECRLKRSAMDNMQVARNFIECFLYNVEPITASAFIEFEIKKHFKLKLTTLKSLISLHKELFKKHQQNKDIQKEKMDLPQWYELGSRGGVKFISGYLADHMSKEVDAFYVAGNFYFYENGVYTVIDDLNACKKTRDFMIPKYTTMSAINDTVGQWKMLIAKPVREINSNPFIINVKNGLYNILNDEFKPHTAKYCSTVQLNARYDLSAKCPMFLKFLKSILQKEEINLLQEIFGYLLIPINKAHKSFVFVGAPRAGKSTLLSVVQEVLLGNENVSNIPWQSLSDRFNKAELFGKLANIFADLPSKSVEDNGVFKSLTGEDYINAERKNKDPFTFKPYAKLLFSCNEIPRNYGDRSDGFYRRLIIIRFKNSVPENKRDVNLKERLATERDGIFLWALNGLKKLMKNQYAFSETESTKSEITRYKIDSNSALSFIDECCEICVDAEFSRSEMFELYRDYCNKNGLRPLSQIKFNLEVESVHPYIIKKNDRLGKRRIWLGLKYIG